VENANLKFGDWYERTAIWSVSGTLVKFQSDVVSIFI